jgi:branched-chain amino acid transport system permease protein
MIGQALADGVLSGAVIALGAVGVSFTLQIMRFANFSHAELLSWGGYIALVFVAFAGPGTPTAGLSFGGPMIVALLAAALLTGALAWSVDRLLFRRLRHRGAQHMTLVFASFGAALVLRHLIVLFWGHDSRFYTRELQMSVEILPGVRVLPDQMFILAVAMIAMLMLHAFLRFSRTGVAMRAVAESAPLAQCCGIEVDRVVRATWYIGGALAAAAGVFAGLTPQLNPDVGHQLLLPLFAAAILGGVGSLAGAVIGGLLVGIAENVMLLFVSPGYKQAMSFMLLLVVLLLRPQGLLGERREGDR